MGLGTLGLEGGRRPMHEINVIPLVDVMLVLLVVFMVTAPLLTHAVKLELPRASNQPNVTRADHVEIAVQRDNHLYWNGEPIARDELEQRAARLAAQAPESLGKEVGRGVFRRDRDRAVGEGGAIFACIRWDRATGPLTPTGYCVPLDASKTTLSPNARS